MWTKIKNAVFAFFTRTDPLSWVSHAWATATAIWVFRLFQSQWYGYILALCFYFIREIGDLRRWFQEPKATRRPFHKKLFDGIGDFSSPAISGFMIVMSPDIFIATAVVLVLGLGVIVDQIVKDNK